MHTRIVQAAAALLVFGTLQACTSTSSVADRDLSSREQAAQANLNLGVAYLRRGDYETAVEKLQRALDDEPRLAKAHSAIALAYDQLGQTDDAEKHYHRAADLAPNDAAIANSYAVFLCRRNDWQKAEPYFKRAADNPAYSTPAVALTNAGTCAMGAGRLDSAEQYFRAALVKNDAYPAALAGLMRVSYQQKNYLETRAFMQRYLVVRPATAPLLWLCYGMETQLGDQVAARKCATQLRQNFPASPEYVRLQRLESNAG